MYIHSELNKALSAYRTCKNLSSPFLLSLNLIMGHWGTTHDFTTSFLHSSLFSTAL